MSERTAREEALKAARKGTTTVGIICSDGVVLAADKKATAMYVENRYEQKVYLITNRIAITTAGMVGDIQYLIRVLKAEAALSEIRSGPITVKGISTLLSNILQANRYYPYLAMLLVGGHDEDGGTIYSVDPVGGSTKGEKILATGSGQPVAIGVLESHFKEGIDVVEGAKLAVKALKTARERDLYTGGVGFDVAVITAKGGKMLSEKDVEKMTASA